MGNAIYRHSQLVLGIHGSHMLIPTALSAGFIEIHPPAQDPTSHRGHWPPPTKGRLAHFLGRFCGTNFSSPRLVAAHVWTMVKGFGRVCGKGSYGSFEGSKKAVGR